MRQVVLDESFERFVARHFGERGRAWLDTLLPVIERYASEWDLTVENFLKGSRAAASPPGTGSSARSC